MRRIVKAVGGAVILLLAAILLWGNVRTPVTRAAAPGPAGKSEERRPNPGSSRRDAAHAGKTVRTLRADAPKPTHSPDELKDFLLPAFRVEDATLEEALGSLFALYHEISRDTGEQPVAFTYRIHGTPAGPISISSHSSFLATLRVLAAFSGCDLARDGSHLTFTAAVPDPDAPTVTQSMQVAPTTEADLLAFRPFPDIDPFEPLTVKLRAMNLLQEGASAIYHPENSTLVVHGTVADQSRLSGLIGEVLHAPRVLFKSRYQVIESPETLDFPGSNLDDPGMAGTLTDAELQSFMQVAKRKEGLAFLTQPTVVSRAGEAATIESGQTSATASGSPAASPATPEPGWTAERTDFFAGGYGFANRTAASFESRSHEEAVEEGRPPTVSISRQRSLFTLARDQWGVVHTAKDDGTHRYTLLNVQRMSADGTVVPRVE